MPNTAIAARANTFVSEWYGGSAPTYPGAPPKPPSLTSASPIEDLHAWLEWNGLSGRPDDPDRAWALLSELLEGTD
jgi:hypothetical protein